MAKKRAPVQDEEMTVGEMLRTPAEPRVEAGKMQEARSSFFSSIFLLLGTVFFSTFFLSR